MTDPDRQSLDNRIEASTGKKQSLDELIRLRTTLSQESTRGTVTKIIIWVYAASIGATLLYLFVRYAVDGTNAFADGFELIKVAIIPVVTFVVGYYYGISKADK